MIASNCNNRFAEDKKKLKTFVPSNSFVDSLFVLVVVYVIL